MPCPVPWEPGTGGSRIRAAALLPEHHHLLPSPLREPLRAGEGSSFAEEPMANKTNNKAPSAGPLLVTLTPD